MAADTKIEWCDATWQPITGCSVVSPGCTNCYAMRLAGTRLQHHWSRKGLTTDSKAGPVWTGEVRFNAEWLEQPLRWRRPRRIFVCAHGDLFAEGVPDEWIDRVFAVMALAPQHIFLVLTKRAARMQDYFDRCRREDKALEGLGCWHVEAAPILADHVSDEQWEDALGRELPLDNVWLGVSIEDQARAAERIPLLLDTPAAKRFISAEPLLAPIDLTRIVVPLVYGTALLDARTGEVWDHLGRRFWHKETCRLDWVIAGGESGPGARPMHPSWARSLRDQCEAAGVPFFFKQWGEWLPIPQWTGHLGGGRFRREDAIDGAGERVSADINPDDVGGQRFAWVGKKAAGRLLDGREWNEVPDHG